MTVATEPEPNPRGVIRHRVTRRIEAVDRDEWKRILVYFVGAAFATAGPLFVDWAQRRWGTWPTVFGCLGASAVAAVVIHWLWPRVKSLRLQDFWRRGRDEVRKTYPSDRGLVVMTFGPGNSKSRGHGESLADRVRDFAKPQTLVLLHTAESRNEADAFVKESTSPNSAWRDTEISLVRVSENQINSAEISNSLRRRFDPEYLAKALFDVTGGTAVMSIAAYLSAIDLKADVCYFDQGEQAFKEYPALDRSNGNSAA